MADLLIDGAPALDTPLQVRQGDVITGSAEVLTASMELRHTFTDERWQTEGWEFFDRSAELRAGVNWLSNAMTKGRLVAARRPRGAAKPVPLTNGPVAELVAQVAGGIEGQSELLGNSTSHLSIPGVSFLVCDASLTNWRVRSREELRIQPAADPFWEERVTDVGSVDEQWRRVTGLVVKSWRPHPRYHWKPDSPCRALLPVLRELQMLNEHVQSSGDSRLAGAGILVLPTEVDVPSFTVGGVKKTGVMEILQLAMETALRDRGAAAARVPIVLRVPGEYVKDVQHLTFDTPFDERTLELREENRKRLATGLDIPPEILTGLGATNHWSAWQIEESALKLHIEPMLAAICMGLTKGFLWPSLGALADKYTTAVVLDDGTTPEDYIVWYDTSELVTRPNNTDIAIRLGDRGMIGVDAVLREAGFDLTDKPTAAEVVQLMALNAVRAHPELAPQILPLIGVNAGLPALERSENDWVPIDQGDIRNPASNDENEPEDGGGTNRAAPDTADNPPPAPNDTTDSGPVTASAAEVYQPDEVLHLGNDRVLVEHQLVAAADGIVFRALEKIGNRIRSRANGTPHHPVLTQLPAHERHTHPAAITYIGRAGMDRLLDGAYVQVPELAARIGVDPTGLTTVLDAYLRNLIHTGDPHTYTRLAHHLGGTQTPGPRTGGTNGTRPRTGGTHA